MTEGFAFQENNASDSELAYVIRSLISEGRIRYCTVIKDENGNLITVEKFLEGPTSFITTTVLENLEPQLEDRLFSIHPDEGVQQTKDIIEMTADQKSGTFVGLDNKTIESWKHYHGLLIPVEVVIPFAKKIAKHVTKNKIIPMSTRRAFKRVLTVIQAITCAYQYQRKKSEKGMLIAEMCDYWMALQIVTESFKENMGKVDEKSEKLLEYIGKNEKVLSKNISNEFGIASSQVTLWTSKKVKDGILIWCNEEGYPFIDDKDLKRAKHSGKAYLKIADEYNQVNVTGLPLPKDLTTDPDWKEDGKFLKMYDLELIKKDSAKVFSGVNQVFNDNPNTSDDNEIVNSITETDDKNIGVKVLSENLGEKENKISSDILEDNLCDEFSDILNDKNTPPFICRNGCKYYDEDYDPINDEIKEYCGITGKIINSTTVCVMVEPKKNNLTENILTF